jgi:hypothetical protein
MKVLVIIKHAAFVLAVAAITLALIYLKVAVFGTGHLWISFAIGIVIGALIPPAYVVVFK